MNEQIKQRIDSVINNIDQLPSIPDVASKIINMINDPDVSFKQVADEISKDQAMTTNILKLANSAYFSKGKEITSVDRAIVTLGLREVKDIIMVIVTKPVLDKPIAGYDLAKGDLWKQGLVVAALSKKLALARKRKDISDIVFTGGILHNVGKVVISLYVHTAFKEIMSAVENNNISFDEAEKEVTGYNHHEVGEKILAKWNFPAVLKSIVRYYQNPAQAPDEHHYEVSTVHIANAVCLMAGIGVGSDGLYHQIAKSAMETVGVKDADMQRLYELVPETVKQVQVLM